MKIVFYIYLFLTCLGPIWLIASGKIDFKSNYQTASHESAHLAPLPKDHPEAIVQVYSARAFNWRGIFASHNWIAAKAKNADQFTVYQVIGWRTLRGLPALSVEEDIPDRLWFNQKPEIILDIRGKQAEEIISKLPDVVKRYPYPNGYEMWPGPNSNTFIAYVGRHIPEMRLAMPANALGKDYTGNHIFVRAPSNTGYQFTLFGLFGIMLAVQEGLEINILGVVYGISPAERAIKLPGFGDIK